VERPAPGVIQKGKCVKPTRARPSGKRCTRYLSVGSFRHRDRVGVNRFRFSGRIGGLKLGPGPYRLKAVALGPSGAASRVISARFRIVL
jgi:hypothetical protein